MPKTTDLLAQTPQEFVEYLRGEDIQRFHLVYDPSKAEVIPSHPQLAPLASFLSGARRDFNS